MQFLPIVTFFGVKMILLVIEIVIVIFLVKSVFEIFRDMGED